MLLPAAAALAQAPQSCEAHSAEQPPAVVELYTSEVCRSCPPADHRLSTLNGRSDVIALAFHVNYRDRLGWPDRFATPANTERHRQQAQGSGSSYVHAPQVLDNGRNWRHWSGTAPARLPASNLALALKRDGNAVMPSVDNGSRVKAGENAGETSKHDHVVTLYKPVEAWVARDAAKSLTRALRTAGAGINRRVVFVDTDTASQRPLQALALGR